MKITKLLVSISCLVFINDSIYSMAYTLNQDLIYGTVHNDINMVQDAIKRGADINYRSEVSGATALSMAAYHNNVDMVKLLLAHGANPNIGNLIQKQNALMSAINSNNINILRLLLDKGANPNLKTSDGSTALSLLAGQSGDINMAKLLLDYKANPNIKNKNGNTPLMWAALNGYNELLKLLLDYKADPNIKNNYGDTVFYYVFNRSRKLKTRDLIAAMIESLLSHNTHLTSAALILAIKNNMKEVVELLLNVGVPLDGDFEAIKWTFEAARNFKPTTLQFTDKKTLKEYIDYQIQDLEAIKKLIEDEKAKREAVTRELNQYLIGPLANIVDEYLYYK